MGSPLSTYKTLSVIKWWFMRLSSGYFGDNGGGLFSGEWVGRAEAGDF